MHMGRTGGRHRVGADEDLIRPEIAFALAFDLAAERIERGDIEALGRFDVARDQMYVIDQPAAVQLLCLHACYAAEGWLNSASIRRCASCSETSSMRIDKVH